MPTHAEQRKLPYTPEQLFTLVADVEKYPAFLPWCLASRITKREDAVFYADLIIGYKMVREKFTSRVTIRRPDHIHVEYLSGPMKYLSNHWKFLPEQDGTCLIDFYLDFEFKNKLFQNLMGVFFDRAVKKMVGAFEDRAHALYASASASISASTAPDKSCK